MSYWLRSMPTPQNQSEEQTQAQGTGNTTTGTLTIEAVQQLLAEQLQIQQQQFEVKLQQQQQQHEQQLANLQQQIHQNMAPDPPSSQPATSQTQDGSQPAGSGTQSGEQLPNHILPPPPPPQVAYAQATQSTNHPQSTAPSNAVVAPEEAPPTFQYKPHVQLRRFSGKQSAVTWWCQFMAYISLHRMPVRDAIQSLHFYLEGAAETWFHALDPIFKSSLETLKAAFMARFCSSSKLNLKMMDVRQSETETVEEYFHRVTSSLADRPIDEDWLIHSLVTGLKQAIKKPVVQADPQTLEQLRNEAIKAEMAEKLAGGSGHYITTSERSEQSKLDTILDKINSIDVAAVQKNRDPCGNCGKTWGNWYTLTLLATVTLVLVTSGAEGRVKDTVDVIDRVNYGTVFKREQDMLISREFWLHTFHIPLPKRFKVSRIPTCLDSCNETGCRVEYMCQMLQVLVTQLHGLHQGVLSNFNETMKTIRRLIPESRFGKDRNLRSLLPFIGQLSRGLFGTATMDDVNIMAGHINEIAKRTNGLVKAIEEHGKHLSSFISIADKRMTNLMSGIKANNKQISGLARVVNLKLINLQYTILNISDFILNQVENANVLRKRFTVLELAVQDLVKGRITPHLIDRPTLTKVLRHLHSHIRKSFKQFYLTHIDPNYYYANAKFVYARRGSQLYVTVKFPLSSLNKPLNLYKVISLPVPVKNNSSLTMHATQLHSLPDYFAITPHHDHYLQLSSKDLVNCQHDSVILCDMNLALTPITVPDCTMALFSNNPVQIKKLCDFRFTQSLLRPNIIELTATSALVYNSDNLVLNCPKEQKIVPGCNFCVVHIPCRCSLSTKTLFFLPRLVDCYNSSETMTMVHPVNLALLQEFFDETKLMNIFGDTTFTKPINLSVPEFQFYNHSFSSIVANDQKAHLSLKKIAKAVKNDQKIFKTLSEPLLDGVISISADWPDLNAILAFSSLGAATLALFLCTFMFCKMRKMATALYILQQVQTVTSSTVPSFIYRNEEKAQVKAVFGLKTRNPTLLLRIM
ncbi:hypothetical protein FSP39_014042 [Pinctada imbricata]|uniref:Retrotransposon gag domain-containing protein n=1 Tax=Pinctada imbricata TaxID=66713 RepID=A0AA89BVN2_PINIB|nr:hypothetical protein FSP39_014042 [Pinctada imbricata]